MGRETGFVQSFAGWEKSGGKAGLRSSLQIFFLSPRSPLLAPAPRLKRGWGRGDIAQAVQ